jgi:hypothetical protein
MDARGAGRGHQYADHVALDGGLLINDSNAYTSVDTQILSNAAGDEAYFDTAMLRTAPVRSETGWEEDSDSIAEYGRIESVILDRERTDDEADAKAQTELAKLKWPRTAPVGRGRVYAQDEMPEDGLIVTCLGMAWTLSWRHALTDGTQNADVHIKALLDESEFFSSTGAAVDANATEAYIESGNPVPLWREMEKIIKTGDGTDPWTGGAYPGFDFRYEARPTDTQYRYHAGQLEYYGGGRVPPLEFYPGWCWFSDMPTEPSPSGDDADHPKRAWLDETWFVYEHGQTRLEWTTAE